MPKTENKTGRNFSSHDRNNPVDYKKVRRDVFELVEQLICSNTILTASMQHNEVLQRKAHLTRNRLREEVIELKAFVTELESTIEGMKSFDNYFKNSPEELQNQLERITMIEEEGDKALGNKDKEAN